MSQNVRRYNKFTFSDFRFAAFVRARMLEVLVQFDANGNQMFEEEEIKTALVQVLNESPEELYYVVQNVFRYDRDGDGKITIREFVSVP
jgi:Ca2+-binding EF-hand superfamily protein